MNLHSCCIEKVSSALNTAASSAGDCDVVMVFRNLKGDGGGGLKSSFRFFNFFYRFSKLYILNVNFNDNVPKLFCFNNGRVDKGKG